MTCNFPTKQDQQHEVGFTLTEDLQHRLLQYLPYSQSLAVDHRHTFHPSVAVSGTETAVHASGPETHSGHQSHTCCACSPVCNTVNCTPLVCVGTGKIGAKSLLAPQSFLVRVYLYAFEIPGSRSSILCHNAACSGSYVVNDLALLVVPSRCSRRLSCGDNWAFLD